MKNNEILMILKDENKKRLQMQKELVKERTKNTSEDFFSVNEIFYFSEYFDISMEKFLREILEIDNVKYSKILKGQVTRIYSEAYVKAKNDYLCKKRKIFSKNINLNTKTYFSKKDLLENAEKLDLNVRDFSIKVLEKSSDSFKRVINDENCKRRLYIGSYVTAKLPETFIDNNYSQIEKIAKWAIYSASKRLGGIILLPEDYKDELQKCMIYIYFNGNSLNKNNIPIIKSQRFYKKYIVSFYKKLLSYEMQEISKIVKNKKVLEYNDNIFYRNI